MRPTNVGLSAATSHCSSSSRGGGRRQRIRYLFELDYCCPMDKAECDMRKKIFFSLLKQHVNNIALGTAMATIGMLLTIASIFCLKSVSWDSEWCLSRSRAEVIARGTYYVTSSSSSSSPGGTTTSTTTTATSNAVSSLAIVHFLFYLRYPGPLLAGMGLFFNIMVILYLLWQTDIKLKQSYVRKPGLDVYERGIMKWKREHKELWKSCNKTPNQGYDINQFPTQSTPSDCIKKRDQTCGKGCKENCKNCKEDKRCNDDPRNSINIKESFTIEQDQNISIPKANFGSLPVSTARRKVKTDIDFQHDLSAEATC